MRPSGTEKEQFHGKKFDLLVQALNVTIVMHSDGKLV
jgi:hypothetical protein